MEARIKPVAKIKYISDNIEASGWEQRYSPVFMRSERPDYYQAPWVPSMARSRPKRIQPRPLGPVGWTQPAGSAYGDDAYYEGMGLVTVGSGTGSLLYAVGHIMLAFGALVLFK